MIILFLYTLLFVLFIILLNIRIYELKKEVCIKADEINTQNKCLRDHVEEKARLSTEKKLLINQYENNEQDKKQYHLKIEKLQNEISDLRVLLRNQKDSETIIRDIAGISIEKKIDSVGENLISNIYKQINPVISHLEQTENKLNKTCEDIQSFEASFEDFKTDVKSLTKVMKNTTRHLGDLGEEILLRVLNMLGLKEDCDFKKHERYNNGSLIPDITYFVDGTSNTKLFIDSKNCVELFEDALTDKKTKCIMNSYKQHIKDLAGKNYTSIEGSLQQVIMFVPSDQITHVSRFSEIISCAYKHNITVATPSTLGFLIKQMIAQQNIMLANKNIGKAKKQIEDIQNSCRLLSDSVCEAVRFHERSLEKSKAVFKRIGDIALKPVLNLEEHGISCSKIKDLKENAHTISSFINNDESI